MEQGAPPVLGWMWQLPLGAASGMTQSGGGEAKGRAQQVAVRQHHWEWASFFCIPASHLPDLSSCSGLAGQDPRQSRPD